MSNVELVIKIPEEVYKSLQILDVKHEDVIQIPLEVIANGTPLPKGHGRLIECERLQEVFRRNVVGYAGFKQLFNIAPTIIEADKAESEE